MSVLLLHQFKVIQCYVTWQVGEFGYLLYPHVQSDLLISFGTSNKFLNFARVGMAGVCMTNPVLHRVEWHYEVFDEPINTKLCSKG